MKTKKIYCLQLLIDHPNGYLVKEWEAWFSKKPTTQNLMNYFEFEANDHESINKINELLAGKSVRIDVSVYMLEAIEKYTFEE
jgi:hypothetical protein